MRKIAFLLFAVLLAGCGKEKAIAPAAPRPERTETKPLVLAAPISDKTEAKPAPRGRKGLHGRGYPTLSSFEAVRWRGSVPEVRVKGVWYELLSLNGISCQEIIAFLKSVEKKEDWQQKRFEEDLVEVLSVMGHDPGTSATLKVRRLDSGQEQVLKDVPMTKENRDRLRDARQQRSFRNGQPGKGASTLTRKQVEADLDQLASLLEHRYAYLHRTGVDYRAALAAARGELGDSVAVNQFACQVMKVLALFGDGHTRVADPDSFLPKGYTPFLVGVADGRFVAFKEDRSGFLDPDHPYLRGLDGIAIEKWLRAARLIAPAGSPQLLQWNSNRNLRYVNYLRQELGLAAKATLQVELASADPNQSRTIEVELAERKPIYGAWPRGSHRLLAGDVGYLRIESMSDDPRFLKSLVETMNTFRRTRGLIIDVRGNGGGSRAVLRELAPFFQKADDPPRVVNIAASRLDEGEKVDNPEGYLANRSLYPLSSRVWPDAERAVLQEFAKRFKPEWTPPRGRFSSWHFFVLRPHSGATYFFYDRPLVILMDSGCFSATDIFLGAFKGMAKAILMGTPSGGGSGRPKRMQLAHSGIAMYLSSMISFRANGELYDGRGIVPDVEVQITATDLIGATDTVLNMAIKRLHQPPPES